MTCKRWSNMLYGGYMFWLGGRGIELQGDLQERLRPHEHWLYGRDCLLLSTRSKVSESLQNFPQSHVLGVSGIVTSSTKIALYITKALKALSSLGSILRGNIRTMWNIARITTKIAKISFKSFTLTGSHVSSKSEVTFLKIKTRSPG